jgi:hypothetical protein
LLKTKEVEISGETYLITQLQTSEMIAVNARVANIAASILPSGTTAESMQANMFQVFLEACKDPRLAEHILSFSRVFAKGTTVSIDGKDRKMSDIFELHFAGRSKELLRWIWESIAHNMGDGFLDLFKRSGGTEVKIPEVSKSP